MVITSANSVTWTIISVTDNINVELLLRRITKKWVRYLLFRLAKTIYANFLRKVKTPNLIATLVQTLSSNIQVRHGKTATKNLRFGRRIKTKQSWRMLIQHLNPLAPIQAADFFFSSKVSSISRKKSGRTQNRNESEIWPPSCWCKTSKSNARHSEASIARPGKYLFKSTSIELISMKCFNLWSYLRV